MAFLVSAALNLLHLRAGFLTNHLADLVVPSWLYVVARGLHSTGGRTTLIQRTIGRTPELAAVSLFMASALTELNQRYWPQGIFGGRFDPWDLLAYGVGLTTCYVADRITSGASMDADALRRFAADYTAAWCSQDAARVASFFTPDGSLTINGGQPAVGRTAIAASAQGFMTAFPDLVVRMDALELEIDRIVYRWTLDGTNTGPGGTGVPVRISGYEEWTLSAEGLVAASLGHFDEDEYRRQLHVTP